MISVNSIWSRFYNSKARYTLFANNSEIGAKWRKNNVRRIVYKRCSPCFANRFFAICCMQDLRRGNSLVDEHKVFFRQKKKLSAVRKLTANNEQCTATRSSRFCQQYFIQRKNNFVPYSSCSRIVYSGLNVFTFKRYRNFNFDDPQIFDGLSLNLM